MGHFSPVHPPKKRRKKKNRAQQRVEFKCAKNISALQNNFLISKKENRPDLKKKKKK